MTNYQIRVVSGDGFDVELTERRGIVDAFGEMAWHARRGQRDEGGTLTMGTDEFTLTWSNGRKARWYLVEVQ